MAGAAVRAVAALFLWGAVVWAVMVEPRTLPYGLVLAAAGSYLLARWPAKAGYLSGERLARASLLIPVTLGLGLPALIGLVVSAFLLIQQLGSVGSNLLWPALLLACGVCILLVALARRWPEHRSDGSFLVLLSLGAMVAKLAVIHLIDAEPVSDFAAMWKLAGQVAEEGLGLRVELTETADWLHFERILPYLLLLRLAFGPGRWSYVLPNVLVTVACSWLTWYLTRRWFGRRAGRVAFTVSLLAAETTLAAGIPTHDIPGTLFALLGLVSFIQADRRVIEGRLWSAIGIAVLVGLLLTLLDLQRTARLFLLAACGAVPAARLLYLWAAGGAGHRFRRTAGGAALVLAVALGVTVAADGLLYAAGLRIPREVAELVRSRGIAGHSDSWGEGRGAEAAESYYRRYRDLSVDDWTRLARQKLVSDLYYNPLERPSSYVRKSGALLSLGRQLPFYLADPELTPSRPAWLWRISYLAHAFNRAFTTAFLAAMLGGLTVVWRRPGVSLHAFLPALYPALLALSLLLLFQPQARYLFPLWYLGSVYAGAFLGRDGSSQGSNDSTASMTSDTSDCVIEV